MPPVGGYAITELASLAGVTPRTIRYYVSVGLVPAPSQVGRVARYTDDHLGRVRLIRRLQEQHLPLAEIRSRLADLSPQEVAAALSTADPQPVGSALDYIRSLAAGARPLGPDAFVAPMARPTQTPVPTPAPGPTLGKAPAAMWERIPLAPDVELHVRRPLGRTTHRRVERLLTIAREILEDQP